MAEREDEAQGRRGGSAEPYVHPPYAVEGTAERTGIADRVRWSPVWAGFVVAFATQLVLFALVFGIIVSTGAFVPPSPGTLGLWTALVALVALFLGGWTAARLAGVTGRWNAVWHGAVVWALILTLGSLATALGLGGVLGFTGLSPIAPLMQQITTAEALAAAVTGAWWFFIGAIVGLIVAILGALAGARPLEETTTGTTEVRTTP